MPAATGQVQVQELQREVSTLNDTVASQRTAIAELHADCQQLRASLAYYVTWMDQWRECWRTLGLSPPAFLEYSDQQHMSAPPHARSEA